MIRWPGSELPDMIPAKFISSPAMDFGTSQLSPVTMSGLESHSMEFEAMMRLFSEALTCGRFCLSGPEWPVSALWRERRVRAGLSGRARNQTGGGHHRLRGRSAPGSASAGRPGADSGPALSYGGVDVHGPVAGGRQRSFGGRSWRYSDYYRPGWRSGDSGRGTGCMLWDDYQRTALPVRHAVTHCFWLKSGREFYKDSGSDFNMNIPLNRNSHQPR